MPDRRPPAVRFLALRDRLLSIAEASGDAMQVAADTAFGPEDLAAGSVRTAERDARRHAATMRRFAQAAAAVQVAAALAANERQR